MTLHRNLQRFLRASLLALLVLGLLVKPVVMSVCETRAAEHAVLAAFDRAHFAGDRDDPGEHKGRSHAHGAHGEADQSAGLALAFEPPMPVFGLIELPRVALPPIDAVPVDSHEPDSPFRPPIA